VPLSFVHCVY